MVYERTRRIPDHEVDFTGVWRLSSALNEMQEMAELHANVLGTGREALGQAGVFWVVSRICVQMREYPTWGEEVLVRTWPENVGNRIFPRHFSFSRPDGETLGGGTAMFLLMDRAQNRIIRAPESVVVPNAGVRGKLAEMIPGKLIPGGALHPKGRRRPRYSDIDLNGHMNNERYAEWVFDLFEPERFREYRVETLQINYLSEARAGDDITLSLGEGEDGRSYVCGVNAGTGTRVFEAMCAWLKKH